MRLVFFAAACLVVAAGCRKGSQADGLPEATEWQSAELADRPAAMPTTGLGRAGARGGMADGEDPHAGMDEGGEGGDPHAGLDLGGGDPHAGLNLSSAGTDVTRLGLPAPDPDRPIDPTHRLAGRIVVDPKAKDRVKPGTAIFVIVKRAGATGPVGSPLAVDKLTWSGDGVAFELTEAQAMIAGTELTGDVIVSARYDQDSDAISKQPGDLTGQLRVTVPADHLQLTLDTILP